MRRLAGGLFAGLALILLAGTGAALDLDRAPGSLRIASFDASLTRPGAGVLIQDIVERDEQVLAVAEIILRARPDVLLLNEFDRDPAGQALEGFAGLLAEGMAGLDGLDYPFRYHAPVNTGVPSGHDLDGDGRRAGPDDAFGYGRFPGQEGMALLSRLPIASDSVRTFRLFRWADLPGADRPAVNGEPHHADKIWRDLRLSTTSHWDVPVRLPGGRLMHLLAAHTAPPVFDGPEDFNGRRNADEIRLLLGLIDGAAWPADDRGGRGGLAEDAEFAVLGVLNADPDRGEARRAAIARLLAHPRLQDPRPTGPGAPDGATAEFGTDPGPGRLRVDYVLPSAGLEVTGAGVFWPAPDDPLARLVEAAPEIVSSDHRLVWVDIRP